MKGGVSLYYLLLYKLLSLSNVNTIDRLLSTCLVACILLVNKYASISLPVLSEYTNLKQLTGIRLV